MAPNLELELNESPHLLRRRLGAVGASDPRVCPRFVAEGEPTDPPPAVGAFWISNLGPRIWIAVGTRYASDWIELALVAPLGALRDPEATEGNYLGSAQPLVDPETGRPVIDPEI